MILIYFDYTIPGINCQILLTYLIQMLTCGVQNKELKSSISTWIFQSLIICCNLIKGLVVRYNLSIYILVKNEIIFYGDILFFTTADLSV